MKPVALIGYMGAGKSTVGYQLAQHNQKTFIDLDEEITKLEKRPISTIFSQEGESYFRQVEKTMLNRLSGEDVIIATGGGIITNEGSHAILRNDFQTVWLKISYPVVEQRLEHDQVRPLWQQPREQRQLLFNQRQSLYEACADVVISVEDLEPYQIVTEIEQHILFI